MVDGNSGSRQVLQWYLYLSLYMMDNRNTHLGQVPGQLAHHISYNLMENTLCQLRYQTLAGNTVAFRLAFDCLRVYVLPAKTKQIVITKRIYRCLPSYNLLTLMFRFYLIG